MTQQQTQDQWKKDYEFVVERNRVNVARADQAEAALRELAEAVEGLLEVIRDEKVRGTVR